MTDQVQDFTIYVKRAGEGHEPWTERYQKMTSSPEQWGRDIVAFFNATRHEGEHVREFVRVEVHGLVPPPEHDWAKLTAMTQQRSGRIFDVMKCERCGITGKRFGLSDVIRRDSLYRAKFYQRCDLTLQHKAVLTGAHAYHDSFSLPENP